MFSYFYKSDKEKENVIMTPISRYYYEPIVLNSVNQTYTRFQFQNYFMNKNRHLFNLNLNIDLLKNKNNVNNSALPFNVNLMIDKNNNNFGEISSRKQIYDNLWASFKLSNLKKFNCDPNGFKVQYLNSITNGKHDATIGGGILLDVDNVDFKNKIDVDSLRDSVMPELYCRYKDINTSVILRQFNKINYNFMYNNNNQYIYHTIDNTYTSSSKYLSFGFSKEEKFPLFNNILLNFAYSDRFDILKNSFECRKVQVNYYQNLAILRKCYNVFEDKNIKYMVNYLTFILNAKKDILSDKLGIQSLVNFQVNRNMSLKFKTYLEESKPEICFELGYKIYSNPNLIFEIGTNILEKKGRNHNPSIYFGIRIDDSFTSYEKPEEDTIKSFVNDSYRKTIINFNNYEDSQKEKEVGKIFNTQQKVI